MEDAAERRGGGGYALRQVRRQGCGALPFHTPRGTQERAERQAPPGKNVEVQPVPRSRLRGWGKTGGTRE